jgi:hypothetical protein
MAGLGRPCRPQARGPRASQRDSTRRSRRASVLLSYMPKVPTSERLLVVPWWWWFGLRRKGRRRTLEQMGGSWFIASANQRPAAWFHRKSGVPVQRLTISLCSAHTVDLCLLLKRVVLHRSGPAHRVVKRPRQSAQLARAARFASERSVFPALFSFPPPPAPFFYSFFFISLLLCFPALQPHTSLDPPEPAGLSSALLYA